MPATWIRRSVRTILVLVVVLLATVAVLPYVASTRLVADRIAGVLGAWSGYRVTIGAPPAIGVWPRLTAVVTDVSAYSWTDSSLEPVAVASRIELDLSPFAALSGDTVITAARIYAPVVRVSRDGPLWLPHLPKGGRLMAAVHRARDVAAGRIDDSGVGSLPDDRFGQVEFFDGLLVPADAPADVPLATRIDGRLDWTKLNGAASLSVTARWRDELASAKVTADAPLRLLAGGEASVDGRMTVGSTSLTFAGTTRTLARPYVNGRGSFSTADFQRVAQWLGVDRRDEGGVEKVTLSGSLVGDATRLKLDQAALEIDGNRGTGAVEISTTPEGLRVSGSLDFERVALAPLVEAFTPTMVVPDLPKAARPIDVDLRLSASSAQAGPVALTDVAASVQVRSAFVSLDILDATAFGGSVDGRLRFDRGPDGRTVTLGLNGDGVEGGALGSALGMAKLTPIGPGSVQIALKGPGDDLDSMLRVADGTIRVRFGPGGVAGIDPARLAQRAEQGGFFPLEDVAGGTWSTESIAIDATVKRGVATLDTAEARSASGVLWLTGVVSYPSEGLALSGGLAEPQQDPAASVAGRTADFFIGGTWRAPFVSPLLSGPFGVPPDGDKKAAPARDG